MVPAREARATDEKTCRGAAIRAQRTKRRGSIVHASIRLVAEASQPATLLFVAISSLASSLLIAMPQLRDPNFRRTVVMLIQHDDEGTFGVVLNRGTELSAVGLCASLDLDWGGESAKPIGWGGPVQPQTGWLVFDAELPTGVGRDVKQVGQGIRFAGSLDVLRQVVEKPPTDLRLLLGYAGWGPGQLESELVEGAWLVAPLTREVVFDVNPSVMWEHVLRSMKIDPSTLIAGRGVH